MRNLKKTFSYLLLIFIIVSCENKKENKFPELIHNDLEYKLSLPDTVKVNKPYKITIEFKSDFDKIIDAVQINNSVQDSTKTRVVVYYRYHTVSASKNINENLTFIDSIPVINKSFEIDNIIFKEVGSSYYYGIISDVIMYNNYNDKGIRTSVRFDDYKQQILKKVVVIE
nr:hypothetical protein [uncultured Flavobacterium sp.]